MNEEQFLLRNFSKYYQKAHIEVERIAEREFGFGSREKKIEARHMAFSGNEQLRNKLVNEPPFYVSYSAAFYERPAIRPMDKKGWKSAQVIFDIDAHHVGELFVCEKCMQWAKDSTIRLVEDFLMADFGLRKEELKVNFSGNRGFHVHVKNSAFEQLSKEERRELADYITATGLDSRQLFKEGKVTTDVIDGYVISKKTLRGPTPSTHGYGGRIVKALQKNNYFGVAKAKRLQAIERTIAKGNWFFFKDVAKKKFAQVIAKCIQLARVDIDVNVTADTGRLIRLPNSIHGSSGLIAKKLDFTVLQKFNPLDDAVVFGANELEIVPTIDIKDVYMKGQTFSFEKDKKAKMPGYLAVYLLCKKVAILPIHENFPNEPHRMLNASVEA